LARGLGGIIYRIRGRIGDTQAHFAARIGVAQNTVSQYESDIAEPGARVLLALFVMANDSEKEAMGLISPGLEALKKRETRWQERERELLARNSELVEKVRALEEALAPKEER
jgi:transcriptional regulator with XRE-family HTH domain